MIVGIVRVVILASVVHLFSAWRGNLTYCAGSCLWDDPGSSGMKPYVLNAVYGAYDPPFRTHVQC